ncbi:MAG: hypothetical protein AB8B91_12610 [Rubripirellula sp.]
MLIPKQYPLLQDLGFPDGVSVARQRWLQVTRQACQRSRVGALIATVSLTFLLAGLGMLPWVAERAFSPERQRQQMSQRMVHGNAHLGAEYYNIASALVKGRGFADPFVVESGPTAWMPPLLVWLQAGLIWLFGGDRFLVMLAVVFTKTLVLCACGLLIVRQANRRRRGWLAFGMFATFILAEASACFGFTHDGWLILAGVTATVFGLAKLQALMAADKLGFGAAAAWGGLGGVVALSSPVAGFSWALGTTVFLMRRAPIKLVVAAALSICVISPWVVRNQIALGKFVPVKSNAFFEFDQSMALDSDGLLDWQTMSTHPYHEGPEQDAYVEMGEIEYLETKKERFLTQVEANPDEYYEKVRNRLIAATLLPAGFSEFSQGSPVLPLRWLIYPLPTLAVIGLLLLGRPLSPLQKSTIVIYVAYLFPYVMCSYYPRYGFPLITVKILLCYWALAWGIRRWKRFQYWRNGTMHSASVA